MPELVSSEPMATQTLAPYPQGHAPTRGLRICHAPQFVDAAEPMGKASLSVWGRASVIEDLATPVPSAVQAQWEFRRSLGRGESNWAFFPETLAEQVGERGLGITLADATFLVATIVNRDTGLSERQAAVRTAGLLVDLAPSDFTGRLLVAGLLFALDDQSPSLRGAAITALAAHNTPECRSRLREKLSSEKHEGLRKLLSRAVDARP